MAYATEEVLAALNATALTDPRIEEVIHEIPSDCEYVEVGRLGRLIVAAGLEEHAPYIAELLTLGSGASLAEQLRWTDIKTIQKVNIRDGGIQSELQNFRLGDTNYPALLLSGFKVSGGSVSAAALDIAGKLGNPYAEKSETGELVQLIQPKKSDAQLQTSASYETPLELHVENVGQEHVPDFVVIACESNREMAETVVVSPFLAIAWMRQHGMFREEALLRKNGFTVRAPHSFNSTQVNNEHQVLEGTVPHPVVSADFADVMPNDQETHHAYKVFQEACNQVSEKVVLSPGDVLVIRNTGSSQYSPGCLQAMHGRGAFTPIVDEEEGTVRTLWRVYVKHCQS